MTDPKLEKAFAARVLEARRTGMALKTYYKMQFRSYITLFIAFGIGIAYFWWLNVQPMVAAMTGALYGVLFRDFGIARAQRRLWPVQEKLLDWGKVERMAGGVGIEPTHGPT